MSPLDILIHLANFAAPALFLAVLLPLVARLLGWRAGVPAAWWMQVLINFICGLLVLLGSLWWWGRDGKMAAYAALVLVVASSQWVLSRAWRK